MLKSPMSEFHFGGGIECTFAETKVERLDILKTIRFDEMCEEDFLRFKALGITSIRLALAWHQIHIARGEYNFRRFIRIMRIARKVGIHIIWDLNHFDRPTWVDLFGDDLPTIFTEYALEALSVIELHSPYDEVWVVPINELSFCSYAMAEKGFFDPFYVDRGWELKVSLVRAAIVACKVMKSVSSRVRFLHPDPINYRHARWGDKETEKSVAEFNNVISYQSWDMLLGLLNPELGGTRDIVDGFGVHYYDHNQQFLWRDKATGQENMINVMLSISMSFNSFL